MDFTLEFRDFLMSIMYGITSDTIRISNDPDIYHLACAYLNGRLHIRMKRGQTISTEGYINYLVRYCGKAFEDERIRLEMSKTPLSRFIQEDKDIDHQRLS